MSITNDIIKEINVDVYDRKIIIVNAKQYDSLARYILVTCYNQGVVFPINYFLQYAYVRMKKPDGKCVFNDCEITTDGKVKIELTEQMLASGGNAIIELVILDKDNTMDVFANTGDLTINNQKIFSTMTFYINIVDSACNCWDIESSDEFNALNNLMIQATKNYNDVISAAKASEEVAKTAKEAAIISEQNALIYSNNAKSSENATILSLIAAQEAAYNANLYSENARAAKEDTESAVAIAESYANESKVQANLTSQKVEEAAKQVQLAKSYAVGETGLRENENIDNSKYYSEQVKAIAEVIDETHQLAKSYAVGETGLRENENIDNSKYYYYQIRAISESLGGIFVPQGTIEFSELQYVTKAAGYVYHISNAFITDETFKAGAGIEYPEGTNVYCTGDGYWDCFATKDLLVTDDDNGNVTIEDSYNSIIISGDEFNALNNTIIELQERIKVLEDQNVLEVVE